MLYVEYFIIPYVLTKSHTIRDFQRHFVYIIALVRLLTKAKQKEKILVMNFNNFTIKSQEAIQQAQQIAQGFGHQQIENEHIFKAIFSVDENVLPFILKKLNVNVSIVEQILDKELESFPKVSGGDIMLSREAGKAVNEAAIVAKKMKDDFVSIEHLILGIFKTKSKFTIKKKQ